jgi:hypothetical protein
MTQTEDRKDRRTAGEELDLEAETIADLEPSDEESREIVAGSGGCNMAPGGLKTSWIR